MVTYCINLGLQYPQQKKKNLLKPGDKFVYILYHASLLWCLTNKKKKTTIENIEDLELLRFLELGFEVKMIQMSNVSVSVDTISSLNLVRKILRKKKKI